MKTYIVRFYGQQHEALSALPSIGEIKREVKATSEYQARKIGEGIAKKNGWKLTSVGLK